MWGPGSGKNRGEAGREDPVEGAAGAEAGRWEGAGAPLPCPRRPGRGHGWCQPVRGGSQTLCLSHPPGMAEHSEGSRELPVPSCGAAGQTAASRSAWQDSWSRVRMRRNAGDGPACQTAALPLLVPAQPRSAPLSPAGGGQTSAPSRQGQAGDVNSASALSSCPAPVPCPPTLEAWSGTGFLFLLASRCLSEGRRGPGYSLLRG